MTDLLSLVESRGIQMRRVGRKHGGEYAGPCPWCGGEDRFHVWPHERSNVCEGTYWCRSTGSGCGRRGDLVNFLMQTSGITFREACYRLNIQMPESHSLKSFSERREMRPDHISKKVDPPQVVWHEKAKGFVDDAFETIWNHLELIFWLKKRGIPEGSIAGYGLGWNQKDYFRSRGSWGLPKIMKEDGRERALWIPPGLVIPQIDQKGKIERIRIRRFGDIKSGARYWVVPGSAMGCYVLGDKRTAVIVEAELDAMAIHVAAGDLVSVVALGSAQVKPDVTTEKMLGDCIKVLVALDSDRAGEESSKWWLDRFKKARFWPVPDGKDPGEAVRAGVDLRAWVLAGLPMRYHV